MALKSQDPDYRAKLDANKAAMVNLGEDEGFFSIDELGRRR